MPDSVQEKLVKYKLDFACVGAPKMRGPWARARCARP